MSNHEPGPGEQGQPQWNQSPAPDQSDREHSAQGNYPQGQQFGQGGGGAPAQQSWTQNGANGSSPQLKPSRPWYKKKRTWVAGLLTLIIVSAIANQANSQNGSSTSSSSTTTGASVSSDVSPSSSSTPESTPPSSSVSTPSSTSSTVSSSETPSSESTADEGASSTLTDQQQLAVQAAQNYLDFSAFSKQGLIDQLSSKYGDAYSVKDATAAVNTLTVDWNEQAAKSAKNYLDMSPFSCSGLIDQLASPYGDKFTKSQATYGAHQTKACA